MEKPRPLILGQHFAHLAEGGTLVPVEVDETFWSTGVRSLPAGHLVSGFQSDADWTVWEMHPNGEELILLTSGRVTLILDSDQDVTEHALSPGQFVIVPRGTWHTADVHKPAMMIFITSGQGTQHRERAKA